MKVLSPSFIKIFFVLVFYQISFSKSFAQNTQEPEFVKILTEYIQFPSLAYKEKEAGEYFLNKCKEKGLVTEVLTNEDTAFNFVASYYPLSSNKPNVIFLNHIDVVSPGDTSLWMVDPFSGIVKDSMIWGRGAIDNKGMAVAQLLAMAKLKEENKGNVLPFNVSILCVAGEETDGKRGAQIVVDHFLKKLNPLIILGEGGSGMKGLIESCPDKAVFGISTTEKSKLVLNLTMEIPSSGHGSVPPDEYAVKEMVFALNKLLKDKNKIHYSRLSVRAMKELGKHEKGLKGFIQRHFTFIAFRPLVKREIRKDPMLTSFFSNTIALTNLKLPVADENQISQSITATVDCRLLPSQSIDGFKKKLRRRLGDRRIVLQTVTDVGGAIKTKNGKYYKFLEHSIKKVFNEPVVVEIIFPATTDNELFRKRGVPVIGGFPACFSEEELTSIHNVNERIHFNSMNNAIKVYTEFLRACTKEGSDISIAK